MDLNLDNLNKDYKKSRYETVKLINRLLALIELTKLKSDQGGLTDWMVKKVAAQFKVSDRTLYRWVKAYQLGGL
jgi:predicted DNA-binding transcriptional regulator YafY